MPSKNTPEYYSWPEPATDALTVIEQLGHNFNMGCALKYIVRHGRKPGVPGTKDLYKAIDCISREIVRLEQSAEGRALSRDGSASGHMRRAEALDIVLERRREGWSVKKAVSEYKALRGFHDGVILAQSVVNSIIKEQPVCLD